MVFRVTVVENTVERWLRQHARPVAEIELGLTRARQVWRRLGVNLPPPVIIVGGTNGKGSVCALLEAILTAGGFKVGCYMSPHLLRFGERIRIGAQPAPDEAILAALKTVDKARQAAGVSLTYFELTTLAAAYLFAERGCAPVVLEVGMGGRLDAVNIFSPAVSVITNIAIDHSEFLGDTRTKIAREKAGICRAGKPVVIGDAAPPSALLTAFKRRKALPRRLGRDFQAAGAAPYWHYLGASRQLRNLPPPALSGAHQLANAACALAALEALPADFWPGAGAVRVGLHTATLPGRLQILPRRPLTVLDVAHNPAAAERLERFLFESGYFPFTRAVFGMLSRKDIAAFVDRLGRRIDAWYVARPRGGDLAAADIVAEVRARGGKAAVFSSVARAAAQALADSGENDRIIVTGSFLVVADFLKSHL